MTATATTAPTFSERVVDRLIRLRRGTDRGRRSFLQKATLVATALTVNPFDFILKPMTAYASVCGDANECRDGWSAFCCTINNGKNTCPPGSYAAGWWKVSDSAFCRGSARYYIDCNRHPKTGTCKCTCADGKCDRRRVCCNNFRYGQCNQQVKGVTPVVCRVITCMPPWEWDPTCTRTSLSSPSTRTHSASCLPGTWPTHIEIKYQDMGLRGSVLGDPAGREHDTADGGRVRRYEQGLIFYKKAFGAHEVHDPLTPRYDALDREGGPLGYPTADQTRLRDGGAVATFQHGRIYWRRDVGAHALWDEIFARWRDLRARSGPLGYPTGTQRSIAGGEMARFEGGAIYHQATAGTHDLRRDILAAFDAHRGPSGFLGFPTSNDRGVGDGRGRRAFFQGGRIWWTPEFGAHEVHGPILDRYLSEGGPGGALGYPTSDVLATRDDRFRSSFEHGSITWNPTTGETSVTRPRPTNDAPASPEADDSPPPRRPRQEPP